jgi:hypothetical protein
LKTDVPRLHGVKSIEEVTIECQGIYSPSFYRQAILPQQCYAVKHNGDKQVSEGLAKGFSAGSFLLTKGAIAVL